MRQVRYNHKVVSAYFREMGLPAPEFELMYIPGRKFRLDVAWPDARVGIECQGGIWIRGAHGRGSGIKRDMEKNNLGILAGWRVLQVPPEKLCLLETARMVKHLFAQGK